MAITVQNVVDQVSTDMRKVLSNSGNDAAILLTYVDRIHKDALHSSVYGHLNRKYTSVNTVAGTASYTLSANDIRRILAVFDRTQQRYLNPMLTAAAPPDTTENDTVQGTQQPVGASVREDMLHRLAMSRYPEFYMKVGATSLYIFPTPTSVDALDVYYEAQVPTVSTLATNLTIPDDGLDMMVAGVNYLTAQYLKRNDEAQMWFQLYERLKRGEMVV